jgi:hypothetical protein
MKKSRLAFILMVLILAACAPRGRTANQSNPNVESPTRLPTSLILEKAMIAQLAGNLDLPLGDVSLVSNEAVEFGDACLGVAMEGVMCAQVITPGYIIVLESNGVQYEYHISSDGSRVQPATLALTWKREGGFAGFCDSLTVFRSGEVYGNRCKPNAGGSVGTIANLLSADEREQFTAWLNELGQVSVDASDPEGVSDRMVVELELYGSGGGLLTRSDEQALLRWAQSIFQKLYS